MPEKRENSDLERELALLRSRLAETEAALVVESELAGMAVVSNGILHNVGNVLNGVVIATDMVKDMTQELRIDGVDRAAKLLEEVVGDSSASGSAQGRVEKLPAYLFGLSKKLESQRDRILEELSTLVLAVDHLKDITKMQQSYAKDDQVRERLNIRHIVDDALKLSRTSLERHHIQVTQDYRQVPDIQVAKHAVLQILINLVRNAKQAMSHLREEDKRLVIRIRDSGDDTIVIQIADNGIGISEVNLPRLFDRGFTTRPDGHGFGLHVSQFTAQRLGGKLGAQSDGEGLGATFTLELPI